MTAVHYDNDTRLNDETEDGPAAHIVKTEPGESAVAKVLEARIMGIPLEFLCGLVKVPDRDPQNLPPCSKCKEIYEMYRGFNPDLNETPKV